MKRVIIAGVGPGSKSCLTGEVKEAINNAEVLIGSKRLIEEYTDKKTFYAVTAKDIMDIIDNEYANNYVVLMSGDTGFYSGAKKLTEALAGKYEYRIMAGVSSVIYLAAKIGKPWENAAFVSLHGKKQSYIPVVLQNELTYFLTQGNVSQICKELYRAGLGQAHIWIGENLSYDNVSEFTEYISEGLTVLAVYNEHSRTFSITGIDDSSFIRSDVPMTKREIRASVVSRMAVSKNSCVYDIGAGTGSVTVELALHALYGTVYAVERTEEGCSLIAKNAEKFGLNNIEIIHGNAAAVIDSLPVPDKVFIGGSGGELEYIFSSILKKNPYVHIVVTAVTLETLNNTISLMEKNGVNVLDIVQIAVTEVKKRGRYHMMSANNPVFIIEGRGAK